MNTTKISPADYRDQKIKQPQSTNPELQGIYIDSGTASQQFFDLEYQIIAGRDTDRHSLKDRIESLSYTFLKDARLNYLKPRFENAKAIIYLDHNDFTQKFGSFFYESYGYYLQQYLHLVYNDKKRADKIYRLFEEHLYYQPDVSRYTLDVIVAWLIEHKCFLGSQYFKHEQFFEDNPSIESNSKLKSLLSNFFYALKEITTILPKQINKIKNIVIITSKVGGGGHLIPSLAIKKFLNEKTEGKYRAEIIDSDEIASSVDLNPWKEQTGYTSNELYRHYNQELDDPNHYHYEISRGAKEQALHPERYSRTSGARIKKKLIDMQADAIISTAQHLESLMTIPYQIGKPLFVMPTDYYVKDQELEQIKIQEKMTSLSLIHLWVPHGDLDKVNNHPYDRLQQKGTDLSQMKSISVFGFPVREEFEKKYSAKNILDLKEGFNINPNATFAFLLMGLVGNLNKFESIIDKIASDNINNFKIKNKLCIGIGCGSNSFFKNKIESYIKGKNLPDRIEFKLFGYLENLAEVAVISDFVMGKPGGSFISEIVALNKPILGVSTHAWEDSNIQYAKNQLLYTDFNWTEDFYKQAENISKKAEDNKKYLSESPLFNRVPDWKNNLLESLKSV